MIQITQNISKYRSELMGWAIVWIMMLHFTFTQLKPIGFVAQFGFAGVDIFMLVSGFGLYFSLDRDGRPLRFYKKRLLRIFPTYYLLGVFASLLVFQDGVLTYLFRYTTVGYWTGGAYWEWYIPSIVLLYLLAPLFKRLFDRRLFLPLGCLAAAIGLAAYYLVDKEHLLDRSHFFTVYRTLSFLFGKPCLSQ